ncbi:hypothetical protein [Haloarchaeobius iranensis]|uniref:Uncharacterized protein n=1 Tax=Haloarchaeobius iranensis TaxID=996166 RepID=A0A1G9UN40_9EURY|nr:hypothetical protein [Haloarchaeobius iranensis]SDM61273.1 hypothetical protein SAMN05192554_104220 [Haloarchaeobius iranensis]
MSSIGVPSRVRSRARRYLSFRVLVLWGALTVLVVGSATAAVHPAFSHVGAAGFALVFLFLVGILGLAVGDRMQAVLSEKWRSALLGAVSFGVAALPIPLTTCLGAGCSGVEALHVFYDWSPVFGPAVAASFAAEPCAHNCPHRVQLLPLLAGYLFLAETITSEQL